jgi:ABC-2 type transport system ATP-binding protein
MTIVLTTHNMFEAEALCERISFINYGKIVAEGTPSELKGKIISENIVEINCSDAKEAIKIISGIEGTASKIHANGLIRVRVDSYGRLRDIMREFSKSRMDVYSVSALEPTFEETYLKLIKKGKKHA